MSKKVKLKEEGPWDWILERLAVVTMHSIRF